MTGFGRFRKKPVVVDAYRNDGDARRVHAWCQKVDADSNLLTFRITGEVDIATLEGTMTADPGDWLIRGVKGELYPCKPDVFEATYEPVDTTEGGRNA